MNLLSQPSGAFQRKGTRGLSHPFKSGQGRALPREEVEQKQAEVRVAPGAMWEKRCPPCTCHTATVSASLGLASCAARLPHLCADTGVEAVSKPEGSGSPPWFTSPGGFLKG